MYSRNRIYISPREQEQMRRFHIVLAGAGLGSAIAECALRMGFETITIIDGDRVELSNLNRQNYTCENIGKSKACMLYDRLRSINPQAQIHVIHKYLTTENIESTLPACNAVVNAIDFCSDAPFVLDQVCVQRGITALHPYNLGWAACVFAVSPASQTLRHIAEQPQGFELHFVRFMIERLTQQGYRADWIANLLADYAHEGAALPPPQLAVGSWLAAGMCADLLFRLATGRRVKCLPEFYFTSIR